MIGIFDSGIGGLTVVRAIMDKLPEYDLIYFGDTARTPYGTKSGQTVIEYALQDTEFLLNRGAKIIVMACNSASSVAIEVVKQTFDVPLFEVITPAVNMAVEVTRKKIIGVIGTRATINSGIYNSKIKEKTPDAKVYSAPCPLLVPLVEEGWLKKPETKMIVKKYLHPLKTRQIDSLILGCTHYPILKSVIQTKIGKRVNIIDSSTAVANEIKTFLESSPAIDAMLSKTRTTEFFVSDITDQFQTIAKSIIGQPIQLNHVTL